MLTSRAAFSYGTFETENTVRKGGGNRNLPYLNAKTRKISLLGTYAGTVANCEQMFVFSFKTVDKHLFVSYNVTIQNKCS